MAGRMTRQRAIEIWLALLADEFGAELHDAGTVSAPTVFATGLSSHEDVRDVLAVAEAHGCCITLRDGGRVELVEAA